MLEKHTMRWHYLVLNCGLWLGCMASTCLFATLSRADDAEFKAVTFVQSMGGTVLRDNLASGQPVIEADLYGTPTTDAGLKQLTGLARLQRLDLSYTKVTDAGMKELARLGQLQVLALAGTKITETGLKELSALDTLETLDLSGITLTAAACKQLAGCKKLHTLFLTTHANQPGLAELRTALPHCRITLVAPK